LYDQIGNFVTGMCLDDVRQIWTFRSFIHLFMLSTDWFQERIRPDLTIELT